ncbi:MAG: hypothetical protein R3D85_07350 [Paracoccaceae bacterium]
MKYKSLAPLLAAAIAIGSWLVAHPVKADPAYGLGLSYTFGSGGGDVAIGARVFSDNNPQNAVGSIGLDYKINSQSFRPNIGAAWLDNDVYGDLSLGYDFGAQGVDFGVGIGGWAD